MADRLSVPVDEVVAAITTKLRSAGYMESTIRLQSREARRLGRWCHEHGGGQYTAVLGAAFAADVSILERACSASSGISHSVGSTGWPTRTC